MNVMVTSISKKIPLLETVRDACEKLFDHYTLYGADVNSNVIGKYFVDRFWEMPKLVDLSIEDFVQYCEDHHIQAVIPTRDGELKYFSKYKEYLLSQGIYVMVSNFEAVHVCLDKLLFYNECNKRDLPAILTFEALNDQHKYKKWVVKERFGAGSNNMYLNVSRKEATELALTLDQPIFQPFIEGLEYSVDLYVSRRGMVKGCICRRREMVVDGESQITTTEINERLETLGKKFAEKFQLYGHIVMQAIVDLEDNYHIVECNSRFGGASTLSLAAGLDSFFWFLLEAKGEDLDQYSFKRSNVEKKLIRYPKDYIMEM